ncbi:E3 ubiquitin-protein ligase SDIR1 [Acorus gramineus]|uniref:E3 ubiquitin-protein ligase SDIR1 n=1 Tax=Acorus gramineus TaxID=55184 RepID=A0AAV9ABW3_ACOGR|nr:E3 ubiquitin-protein ligase SDIR1 [Acorus gramineus]
MKLPSPPRISAAHLILFIASTSLLRLSSALVRFTTDSSSVSFVDAPAKFTLPVNRSGICGSLHVSEPIDGCSSIRPDRRVEDAPDGTVRFALIERGRCSFEEKVRNAQERGFRGVIVYDDRDKANLISMIGDSEGVWIHAVFVSKIAGETLKQYARGEEGQCCIGYSSGETAGTVLVISFVSIIVMVSVSATIFLVQNCRLQQHNTVHACQNINRRVVEVLPSFTFTTACQNRKCTAEACSICLEDYKEGEVLRVLPCKHDFHSVCVDLWLTKWGTFCPICKLDISSVSMDMIPPCEQSPLFSC